MSALIRAKNLTKVYGAGENQTLAISNISVNINRGEFVAIIGPSGSGKSTLMHILGCLDKPTSGEYYFENKQVCFLRNKKVSKISDSQLAQIRNQKIGFVFQFFNLLPRTSAVKNVQLPLIYSKVAKNQREERAIKLLESVGLSDKLAATPSQLSGGQQQKVAIARALINNPLVIFADEPTGNLDTKSSAEIMKIFRKLNKESRTIVMVTHEKEIAKNASRIITLSDGKIVRDKK